MIHVVDFRKIAFSTFFRGILPPSGPQIIAEGWQGVDRGQELSQFGGQD